MSNNQAPTIGEVDERFKPTVINLLKNGQLSVANGCGEWSRYDSTNLAMKAVGQMVHQKRVPKCQFDAEDIEIVSEVTHCGWTSEEEGGSSYNTGCGRAFYFDDAHEFGKGGIEFCMFCGKPIDAEGD